MAGATAAQLDFTNVKDGGAFNKKHQPPGDYPAKITKVVDAVKKTDDAVKMWLFTIEVGTGSYPFYCNRMAENQLWKIRNLFVAAGMPIPKKRVQVDPNKLVGAKIGVTLDDEEYDGKMQSVVQSTFPLAELEGNNEEPAEEDDEEVPQAAPAAAPEETKSKKDKKDKKGKKAPKVSDDELEELELDV